MQTPHSPAVKALFVVAAAVTFGAIALGSVVCATDSSSACPNWPGCYPGQIGPEVALNPIVEFVHRVVAVSTAPLLLACGIVGWLRSKDRLVRILPWVALVGAFIAGVLGMLTVKIGISKWWAAFDLGASLVAVIAITVAAVCVLRAPRAWTWPTPAKVAWAAVGTLFVYHVTSICVAGPGSLTRCVSWPIWRLLEIDGGAAGQWFRLVLGAMAVLLTVATVVLGLRRADTRWFAVAVAILVVVELLMGLTVVNHASTLPVKALYAAVAGAIFTGNVWIAALTSLRRR